MKTKNKYFLKIIYSFFLNILLFNKCYAAGPVTPETGGEMQDQAIAFAGSGFSIDQSLEGIIALIIKAFLGLLGIIFIVLIVMAGYKWMNAAGNEEKVTEAKDTIRRAIIGLIITVSAYAITYFVFTHLPGGGGTSGTGPTGSP